MKSSKDKRRTETEKSKRWVEWSTSRLKKKGGHNGRKEKGDSLLECLEGEKLQIQSEKEQKDEMGGG